MSNNEVSSGKKWPWIIGLSIVGVVVACVVTIKVALNNPVEMSDYGMQNYHSYDQDVNQIIAAKNAFDAKYSISFETAQLNEKGSVVEYKLVDKEGNSVNNGSIEAVLTRPDTTKLDVNLTNLKVDNGHYRFDPVDLPKVGRWDILAKVSVGNDQRYYNLKADTRNPNTFEF